MIQLSLAPLVNLLGFAVGAALYALLLVMVWQPIRARAGDNRLSAKPALDRLLSAAALLGLIWNFGNIVELVWRDLLGSAAPLLAAASHAALGFLPAVVVHSAWRESETAERARTRAITWAAYLLSGSAAVWQFYQAAVFGESPATVALQILTVGYLLILAALFVFAFNQTIERKAIWATALAVFAISALHLSLPHDADSFWAIELVGHHASLLLACAILLQNYKFAFADLFLKRALSLVLLVLVACGLYAAIAAPILALHESHPKSDPQVAATVLGLSVATALVYPALHRFAVYAIDKIVLRRANYQILRDEIVLEIGVVENGDTVIETIARKLQTALTANRCEWTKHDTAFSGASLHDAAFPGAAFSGAPLPLVETAIDSVEILIATDEAPFYRIVLGAFGGARRLLSDEISMLRDVADQTARRINVLRRAHERCERELREQQFSQLASEAELRALRAQINPHFLFNALTTIGYLISAQPTRALDTLLQLTKLLRGVLNSGKDFLPLDTEIQLLEAYLEIEKARFEERLTIEMRIAPELRRVLMPTLILQPLVENAVKHGISPKKAGGTISIVAERDEHDLILIVADTGVGVAPDELERQRQARVGLNNVEQRLKLYFDNAASLTVESAAERGTIATIKVAIGKLQPALPVSRRILTARGEIAAEQFKTL